ncbi:MAG: hypothetical protein LBJ12_04000 [Oscillospiraceae bacterium]|nr:hypothetical protein [Oscillospiraceae bacterium]
MDWLEVDFSSWRNPQFDKARFDLLKQAIIERKVIKIVYAGANGEVTERKAEPVKLLFKARVLHSKGQRQDGAAKAATINTRTFEGKASRSILPKRSALIIGVGDPDCFRLPTKYYRFKNDEEKKDAKK